MKIIFFTAPWCTPCHAMKPVIDWLKADVKVVDVSNEDSMALAKSMWVTSTPTIIFKKWDNEERVTWLTTLEALIEVRDKLWTNG